MNYIRRRTVASTITGVAAIVAYIIFALRPNAPASDDLQSWAIAILSFIGICIVAGIVIQVVFHIVFAASIAVKDGESEVERIIASESIEDERVKRINQRGAFVAYVCSGIGAIVALVVLALGGEMVMFLHILFGAFAFGGLLDGIVQVCLLGKGE